MAASSPRQDIWDTTTTSLTPPNSAPPSAPGSPPMNKKPGAGAARHRQTATQNQGDSSKRTVCDHCRRRRIRCDGLFPCQHCRHAALVCRREHVPKKRGPKRGHGRVIDALRAQEQAEIVAAAQSRSNSPEHPDSSVTASTPRDHVSSPNWSPQHWQDLSNHREITSAFTTPSLRPTSRSYMHLIPTCVSLYGVHIYSIMPFVHMPTTRQLANSDPTSLPPTQAAFLYSLCALTALHMSGRSLSPPSSPSPSSYSSTYTAQNDIPPPWEAVGRFFLDEAIATRRGHDFLGDEDDEGLSVEAVATSFFLSTGFFEIGQDRKSWFYLRESVTLALEMGLDDESKYAGLRNSNPVEELRRRRTFWQLFVTERSYAVLRGKPIAFARTPRRCGPRAVFRDVEDPEAEAEVAAGFEHLVGSYAPLDSAFVEAWNRNGAHADGETAPGMREREAATYLALQTVLAAPAPFLFPSVPDLSVTSGALVPSHPPTAIQKADLLVTQQWLRLIVWQRCLRAGLLSWPTLAGSPGSVHDSMSFSYPLQIAASTAQVLASLPPAAVEVHGMGIMEKIFDVGAWFVAVLGASTSGGRAGDISGGGLLAPGWGKTLDPIEFFVGTLSAQPNSNVKFAEKLLKLAGETPACMRGSLGRSLTVPTSPDWPADPMALTQSREVEVLEDNIGHSGDLAGSGRTVVGTSDTASNDGTGLGISEIDLLGSGDYNLGSATELDSMGNMCGGISLDGFDDTLGFDLVDDASFTFGDGVLLKSGQETNPNPLPRPLPFRYADDESVEMASPVCYMGEAGLY